MPTPPARSRWRSAPDIAPGEIVFTGVGKTREELEYAIAAGIGVINAESAGELDRIAALAAAAGREARVALRVNPDIDAGSHPNISTGLRINKFGVAAAGRARHLSRAPWTCRDCASSAFTSTSARRSPPPSRFAAPPRTLATLALELRDDGFAARALDVGGGLGIAYEGRPIIGPAEYARAVISGAAARGLPVVLEPGRAVVGHAGALVARVVDTKRYPDGRQFAVLDAGMGELMRPALYGSFHRIVPVRPRAGAEQLVGHRRSDLREQRRLRARSARCRRSRSRTWSRFSTPARTGR